MSAGRWQDVSVVLRDGTPEWPGDTPWSCGWTWRITDGASVNLSSFTCSPHVGTHADAPLHVRDGADASHLLPVDAFLGAAHVCDVRGLGGALELEALRLPAEGPVERILLRTGLDITSGRFPDAWPALSPACLRALADRGLRLVGVDCPSVDDRQSTTLDNHHTIFGCGAYVLENLDLRGIEAGRWELCALPLRVAGLDAAPVRALLRHP